MKSPFHSNVVAVPSWFQSLSGVNLPIKKLRFRFPKSCGVFQKTHPLVDVETLKDPRDPRDLRQVAMGIAGIWLVGWLLMGSGSLRIWDSDPDPYKGCLVWGEWKNGTFAIHQPLPVDLTFNQLDIQGIQGFLGSWKSVRIGQKQTTFPVFVAWGCLKNSVTTLKSQGCIFIFLYPIFQSGDKLGGCPISRQTRRFHLFLLERWDLMWPLYIARNLRNLGELLSAILDMDQAYPRIRWWTLHNINVI